jgi:ligand-binding sensor domain-containing protein/AraC-like DNA-binding protein/DNA-binding NarL/FixJ family response regulator
MNSMLKKTLLLVALLLPMLVEAQYLFKTLDARDGLTSSQVNCILKDSRGYMWFGTPAGLYRYDGYTFRHFQCDSQDGQSLPDSYIENIQEAMSGNLWVKTSVGYCVYEPQTENFERDMRQVFNRMGIKQIPELIYIDSHQNLWAYIPSRGVIGYNMQQQLQFEFEFSGGARLIPQGTICSIGECKEGALLVYDDGCIVCCDIVHQQQVLWTNTAIADQHLRKTKTLHAFADQMENIWLYGQGTLFRLAKNTGQWNTEIGNSLSLTGIGVDYGVNGMGGDRSGNVWIATNRHGLVKCNVNTLQMDTVRLASMMATRRIRGNGGVRSVYVDNSDLLWVGTAKSGVAYMGKNIYKFESTIMGDITAMAIDSTGNVWYGTGDNGVIGYDGPLASLKVSAMAYTKDGSLWVGSPQNGLTRIQNGTARIYSMARDSTHRMMIDDHINALASDKSGNLWVATDGGLQVYNQRMNQFSNYTKENGKIRTNSITSLFYGRGNKMLIGTSEGLAVMNISTGKMDYYVGNSTSISKFTNSYVTQVFEDSRGLIWVGTREGVNIWDPESDMLNYLTEKQDLCNNNICGIAEDQNHNIWLTTSNGVSRVVSQRNHEEGSYDFGLYNYTYRDGLQSDEFNVGAILTRDDGTVLLGGLNGISWARKKTADEKEAIPPVILTQLYVGEEEILVGRMYDKKTILPLALNEMPRISLNSDQNTITIKFAAGSYNQSESLQFNYQMEGWGDGQWHSGDAMKHGVTFTDLSYGKYRLHVKAISADGDVSNMERVIEIEIERPWYLTYTMLVVYALVIALIIYLWKRGIDKLLILWKKKKAVIGELMRQREQIKAASDDLRQPMSRMTTIIMNLAERDSSLEEREQLNALHAQMLQLITRVSDMQSELEHPEEKAREMVQKHYLMNGKGELHLNEEVEEELTSELKPYEGESPTSKFRVVFIDDNKEFLKFVSSRLKYVYEFHSYDDIHKAAADIEEMMPDVVVCKQDMPAMTGSELCKNIKLHQKLNRIKFMLMTDTRLSAKDMLDQGITMGADDYLSKPFNLQEVAMRINKLLGVGPIDMNSNLIEGAETRKLEGRNASMTTATETMELATLATQTNQVVEDEQMKAVVNRLVKNRGDEAIEQNFTFVGEDEMHEKYSMSENIDRQLLNSIEQYVQQNMSRGTINLEEMAQAMGMAMRPFYQKVVDITGKTPAEVVRDIRLRHACILLQRTNINMSELATHVGFATGEHFIALFKERFGMAPSQYRLKYRK